MMKIIFFLLISVQAFAQLQPLNVPGDAQRQINIKSRNNFNYLETRTDSIVANLSGGGPGGETYNGDPTVIVQDATHRFVTDLQITDWNSHAEINHNHDADYQPLGDYALSTHNHDASYSAITHNHDAVYQPLGSYALSTHNHDATYAPLTHAHDLSGDRGDISNTGTNGMTWTIDANAVTTTKINNSAVTGAKIAPSTITDSDVNDVAWSKITGAPSFSLSTHDHAGIYQPVGSYSLTTHDHAGVYQPVGDYASGTHNHDALYQPIGNYALSTHNHDAAYSAIGHLHTGVYEPEGDYALSNHNHDGTYATASHNHDGTYATPAQVNAKVEDNITDGATTTAPSENAVFDALAGKQNTLVSGTNIKTINGTSILGSGDIAIAGGGGASETKLILAADVTASTTTPVALTGMTFSYDANSTYRVNMYMIVTAPATTTGHGFGVDTSTAPTTIALGGTHVSNTSGGTASWQAIADNAIVHVSGGVPVAAALNAVQGQGVIITGGTSGTATFIFRSEVAAATTCKAGSVITVLKVN